MPDEVTLEKIGHRPKRAVNYAGVPATDPFTIERIQRATGRRQRFEQAILGGDQAPLPCHSCPAKIRKVYEVVDIGEIVVYDSINLYQQPNNGTASVLMQGTALTVIAQEGR